jgi:hypothetical protein
MEGLVAAGLVADNTLLIVNHIKGREKPKTLLPFLDSFHKRVSLVPTNKPTTIAGPRFRYDYVLQYYHSMLWEYGFSCMPKKVFEYRDKAPGHFAVNMIQYFFSVKKAVTKRSSAALKASFTRSRRTILTEALEATRSSSYEGKVFKKRI